MAIYDVGDVRRLRVTFTDIDGVVADPGAVTFALEDPRGLVTGYAHGVDAALVKVSTGVYHVDYTILHAGHHAVRFAGTGVNAAAVESSFTARHRQTGVPA